MEKENPLVNKFLKQISKIIDHKLEKLTTVESAIVDQVNLDGTVNLHIPPDSTIFTNIQNQSIYQDLQVGDCVKVLKQNNKASNMWIIGGHDLKRSENIESFKGVDYVVEQGQNGIWAYRKWNSGRSELWGISQIKLDIPNTAAGNNSLGLSGEYTWAIPTGFLTYTQGAVVSINDTLCWIGRVGVATNKLVFQVFRTTTYNDGVAFPYINAYVFGRWK